MGIRPERHMMKKGVGTEGVLLQQWYFLEHLPRYILKIILQSIVKNHICYIV